MTKQRDKACKQDINRILLLDSDSLEFKSFGFGFLNCPSLPETKVKPLKQDMDDVHSPPNNGRMNGQAHESLSGLTTLISFNTEGFSREKADILSSLCRVNNCAILLLQETHRTDPKSQE